MTQANPGVQEVGRFNIAGDLKLRVGWASRRLSESASRGTFYMDELRDLRRLIDELLTVGASAAILSNCGRMGDDA